MVKDLVSKIDGTPSKRIYRSIIADYGFETAICELIDNSIDAWLHPRKTHDLKISILADTEQQTIRISDNAGGVAETDLRKLISPGETSVSGDGATIGIFGVGSKRAVVALSQQVQISTRFRKSNSYRLEYDDEWLSTEDWELPYHILSNDINPSSTEILMSRLRFAISNDDVERLSDHLSSTYGELIEELGIFISLNGTRIEAHRFNQWSFSEGFEPKKYTRKITLPVGSQSIKFQITGGLRRDRAERAAEYGVYIYCNGRLIARALKSPEVGFIKGHAGQPHFVSSLVRVVLMFEGPSGSMPWNSSKTGINYNHPLFAAIRDDLLRIISTYAAISKRLSDEYESKVEPFQSGDIPEEKLADSEAIKPSRLPAIPRARGAGSNLLNLNRAVMESKPWTRGLCEALVAEKIIGRHREFEQQTRLSLIILDSTMEIAMKDYLAYEVTNPLGDDKLKALFNNRISVHAEVMKTVPMTTAFWKSMEYYYKLRCDLIHKRASSGISKSDIDKYRKLTERFLRTAFSFRFPNAGSE